MANKLDAKQIGLTTLLGTSVVVLTPIIGGFLGGVDFLAFEIIPNILSLGIVLSAGIAAFVTDLAITKWLRYKP